MKVFCVGSIASGLLTVVYAGDLGHSSDLACCFDNLEHSCATNTGESMDIVESVCDEEQQRWLRTFKVNLNTLESVSKLLEDNERCARYYESIIEPADRMRALLIPQFIRNLQYHDTIYSPLKLAGNSELTKAIFSPPGLFQDSTKIQYGGNFFKNHIPQDYFSRQFHKDPELIQPMLKVATEEQMNKITSIEWIGILLEALVRDSSARKLFVRRLVNLNEMIPDILVMFMRHNGMDGDLSTIIFGWPNLHHDELYIRCMAAHCGGIKVPPRCLVSLGGLKELYAKDRLSKLDAIAIDRKDRASKITALQCRLNAEWINPDEKVRAIDDFISSAPSNFISPYTANRLNGEKEKLELEIAGRRNFNIVRPVDVEEVDNDEVDGAVWTSEVIDLARDLEELTDSDEMGETVRTGGVVDSLQELEELVGSVTITSGAPPDMAALWDRARKWIADGGLTCQEYKITEQLVKLYAQPEHDIVELNVSEYVIDRADRYLRLVDGEEANDIYFVFFAMGYLLAAERKLDFTRLFKDVKYSLSWPDFCIHINGRESYESSIFFRSKLALYFSLDELRLMIDSSV
jgi:hypothetical protein